MMRASVEDFMIHRFFCLLSLGIACLTSTPGAYAADVAVGSVTGQPIPRFVSLKASQTNLREGPSRDHRIAWVFKRAGLPVEVIAEFETWRRIRDSEGSEGWVMLTFISSRRTALVAPWSKEATLPLYERDNESAEVVARLQPSVLTNVEECSGKWCRVNGEGFRGWMQQEKLWGAYPGEKLK